MIEKRENKFQILLLSLSAFFSLICGNGSFSVQSIVLLVILSIFSLFLNRTYSFKLEKPHKIFLVLIIIITISTAINSFIHNDVASMDNFIELFYFFAIFIWFYLNTINYVSKKNLKKIISCYNIASMIMSIQILIMSLTGTQGKIMITNFAGTLMDENYVTALISLTPIYGFIDLLYNKKKLIKKIFIIAEIIICSAGVVLAGSRAALIGMILGLMFSLLYYLKGKLNAKKMFAIILILIIGVFFIFNLKNIMPTWIYNRYFNSNYMDNSNNTRILIWKNALHGIENQPILGFGMGTFPNLKQYIYTAGKSTPAHQTILDIGLYSGIIGIITFLIFICYIFFPILKNKNTKKYVGLLICLTFISCILSATKTVFLWNNLIYLYLIFKCYSTTNNIEKE